MVIPTKPHPIGLQAEELVKPILENHFGVTLTSTEKYNMFDFCDENKIYYELKSRNNKYDQYPTTMVGANKTDMLKTVGKVGYFVFLFTDGLYYYKYEKTTKDPLEFYYRVKVKDDKRTSKKYCYIPIGLLTKIETDII